MIGCWVQLRAGMMSFPLSQTAACYGEDEGRAIDATHVHSTDASTDSLVLGQLLEIPPLWMADQGTEHPGVTRGTAASLVFIWL
jgi:hypothetical protein